MESLYKPGFSGPDRWDGPLRAWQRLIPLREAGPVGQCATVHMKMHFLLIESYLAFEEGSSIFLGDSIVH